MKRILVSPLSWGLGHATRTIPIIHYLRERGHHVTVAACRRPLTLLKRACPECDFVEMLDYPLVYSTSRQYWIRFFGLAPMLMGWVERERVRVERLLRKRRFDMIFSDNRFNVRSPYIPSFVMIHQLCLMPPVELYRSKHGGKLEPLQPLMELYNAAMLRPFDRIIVPDYADPKRNLTGRMSHGLKYYNPRSLYYAGILANIRRMDVPEDVDIFISISGPEPQRTALERVVLSQVERLPDRRIEITLGKPEARDVRHIGRRITVHGFLDREAQQEMLNRARLVVCRSGYTTIMELAELGKKALITPTPGQPEQEYLAMFLQDRGYFHAVTQYNLDLVRDVELARKTTGIPFRANTRADVERLYEDLFAPVLDC